MNKDEKISYLREEYSNIVHGMEYAFVCDTYADHAREWALKVYNKLFPVKKVIEGKEGKA